MKNNVTIAQQLCDILAGTLDGSLDPRITLSGGTDLVGDLALESIQVMEFIVEVEDHYDIAIDLDALASIRTIDELAQLVRTLT